MHVEDKHRQIVEQVHDARRVLTTELAEHFGIALEMIRRDLTALDRSGALRKVRGGVIPVPALSETGVTQHEQANPTVKQATVRTALAWLAPKPGTTLLIDAGTTTGSLARLLPGDNDLTVITNSVLTTVWLAGVGHARVRILGGQLRGFTRAIVGPGAAEALSTLRVDVAVLRANGLSAAHGPSTPDPDRVIVRHTMVRSACRVVALVNFTKIGQEHLVSFASLDDIDLLVTDVELPPALIGQLTAAETEVLVA